MKHLFAVFRDWRERRAVLRELAALRADEREVIEVKINDDLSEALALLRSHDQDRAHKIWLRLLSRYPQEVRASPVASQVLMKLGHFEEAECLIREGRQANPGDGFFAAMWAEIARARGDHQEVLTRCTGLRGQFPSIIQGFFLGAQSLAALGRWTEAEVLCKQAIERFPEDIRGFVEYARISEGMQNWAEALERWRVVRDKFGAHSFGHLGCGRALMQLHRCDEADEILGAAIRRFPMESGLLNEWARCAEVRGDSAGALDRWRLRLQRFPLELHGYCDAAAAFERLGCLAQADATLQAALDRFPGEQRPAAELARLRRRSGCTRNGTEARDQST